MPTLKESASNALKICMGLKEDETVLVITDEKRRNIGYALWEIGRDSGNETIFVEIIERNINGEEPPEPVARLMQEVDVVIIPTTKSLTHTNARREACKSGARVGTLPGITEDMMIRTMSADYHKIAKLSDHVTKILDDGKLVHVTSPSGTDIKMPIDGIKGISSRGLVTNPGEFGNLPSGEAYLMPEEGKSNGVIVVDGALAGIGLMEDDNITIEVKDGYATKITGGKEAKILIEQIEKLGKQARNIAEFGVGTNYMAKLTGQILEDEKIMGTIHIALGNNITMGGTHDVKYHVDGIIMNPTVTIDGKMILDNGKPLFE